MQWDDLDYWRCGEWQVIQERLDDFDLNGVKYNPSRECLFAALDRVDFDRVKVLLLAQDPYPEPKYCTGIAFSIPEKYGPSQYPPTLDSIYKEYVSDLGYPYPTKGDLTPWCEEGVLLLNAIPSCYEKRSMSHDWPEWWLLTEEIIRRQAERDIVMVFLGGVARRDNFISLARNKKCQVLEYSHPSPRGSMSSKTPFRGSRMFTTINDKLKGDPINWRL